MSENNNSAVIDAPADATTAASNPEGWDTVTPSVVDTLSPEVAAKLTAASLLTAGNPEREPALTAADLLTAGNPEPDGARTPVAKPEDAPRPRDGQAANTAYKVAGKKAEEDGYVNPRLLPPSEDSLARLAKAAERATGTTQVVPGPIAAGKKPCPGAHCRRPGDVFCGKSIPAAHSLCGSCYAAWCLRLFGQAIPPRDARAVVTALQREGRQRNNFGTLHLPGAVETAPEGGQG